VAGGAANALFIEENKSKLQAKRRLLVITIPLKVNGHILP